MTRAKPPKRPNPNTIKVGPSEGLYQPAGFDMSREGRANLKARARRDARRERRRVLTERRALLGVGDPWLERSLAIQDADAARAEASA